MTERKARASLDGADGDEDGLRREAFEQLAADELRGSYQLAARILGDSSDAEDAVHEAVLKAWNSFGSLRERDVFVPWFRRIVVNVCRNRLRHKRVLRMVPLVDEDREGVDPFESGFLRDAVSQAVDCLSADQRIAVVLRYWKSMSLEEIARATAVPIGTVKWRLHNANGRMRKELDRLGWEVER